MCRPYERRVFSLLRLKLLPLFLATTLRVCQRSWSCLPCTRLCALILHSTQVLAAAILSANAAIRSRIRLLRFALRLWLSNGEISGLALNRVYGLHAFLRAFCSVFWPSLKWRS